MLYASILHMKIFKIMNYCSSYILGIVLLSIHRMWMWMCSFLFHFIELPKCYSNILVCKCVCDRDVSALNVSETFNTPSQPQCIHLITLYYDYTETLVRIQMLTEEFIEGNNLLEGYKSHAKCNAFDTHTSDSSSLASFWHMDALC